MVMALTVLVYEIWNRWNRKLWQAENISESEVVRKVKNSVKIRASMGLAKCKEEDRLWFNEL